MSRREYRRRASLGKCHRGGRCRWVRGVPADRPASVASLSALLAVSRPQTPQATPPTREQRLRCVLCLFTCLDPKHHVAHPFVWHDVRSGVVFDRGCHQFEHVSMPLVSLVHQTGAEVDATLHRVEVPSRPRRSADASGPPASSRCARLFNGNCIMIIDFPVHARPTEHSMHLRSRTDAGLGALSAASGWYSRVPCSSQSRQSDPQRCGTDPAPYAVVRVVSQMISMEPTRLRIAWLTSRFLRDAP